MKFYILLIICFVLICCDRKNDNIRIVRDSKGNIISKYNLKNGKLNGWSYLYGDKYIRYLYFENDELYTDIQRNTKSNSIYYLKLKPYIENVGDTINITNNDSFCVKFFTLKDDSIKNWYVYIYNNKPKDAIKDRPCYNEIYKDINFIYFTDKFDYYLTKKYYYIDIMYIQDDDDPKFKYFKQSKLSKTIYIRDIINKMTLDRANIYAKNRNCK